MELTGIMKGTGAKMKALIEKDFVTFRGALKQKVPRADVSAEARGTLLILYYKDHVVELAAGPKAAALAKKVNLG